MTRTAVMATTGATVITTTMTTMTTTPGTTRRQRLGQQRHKYSEVITVYVCAD